MATETTDQSAQHGKATRHSALEELYRDERRPALLLLTGLVIAVLFFALGIMVGRWMTRDTGGPRRGAAPQAQPGATNTAQPTQTPAASVNTNAAQNTQSASAQGRYSLLIATFNRPEDAQPLIKKLEEAGYKDVRTSTPRAGAPQPKFSILLGHYTRDEAEQLAARMRSTGDVRLKYVRVIEAPTN
jgi:septal ring-binding cell division protein DamX